MKVLLVHNFYQSSSPSGEDAVFKGELELLRANGVEVITYQRHNDDILETAARLRSAATMVWSKETYRQLRALIKKEKTDLAHFHNIWYLISPSAYYACRDAGIPVVQTLHNFRFFCANGLLLREEAVCEACLGRAPWQGFYYGCYRDSRLYSVPVVLTQAFHRLLKTWTEMVDAYIALTRFAKAKFLEAGLPAEKVYVKPNFLPQPPRPSFQDQGYAVFLGRLSPEKGLGLLLEGWRIMQRGNQTAFGLKIVGDGPLLEKLQEQVRADSIAGVEFLGRNARQECMEVLRGARFLVLPSVCYEMFPVAVVESYACGKPVVAANLGGLAEIVRDGETGLLFEPGCSRDLARKMALMFTDKNEAPRMGRNAWMEFEAKYTARKNFTTLMGIYRRLLIK
jgi:glycosyltransferase involved in cell wall biosynthesis